MPRVVVRNYDASDFDHGQGVARGFVGLGQALGDGLRESRVERARGRQAENEMRARAAEQERAFAIEEQEAAAKVLEQENRAAERAERGAKQQADRDTAVQEFRQATTKQGEDALRQDIGAALRRAGGVLGPFGILDTKTMTSGLKRQAEIGQRMQGIVAQAREMTGPAARAFMVREAERLKEEVKAGAFQEEFDLLSALQREGKISPDDAQRYNKELQDDMLAKKDPGATHEKLLHASELYVQAQHRAEGWEKADRQAPAMIDGLRKILADMPDGVDPMTGKSLKGEMMKRLSAADVEWGRVKPGANGVSIFRQKNDPENSLAGLQKILFEAQTKADPEEFMRQDRARQVAARHGDDYAEAEGVEREQLRARVGGGQQSAQEATQGGAGPGRSGGRSGPGRGREQAAGVLMHGAQKALSAGTAAEQRAATRYLLNSLEEHLGIDAASPEAIEIANEVLAAAKGG